MFRRSVRSLQGALPSPVLPSPVKSPTSIMPKLKNSKSSKSIKLNSDTQSLNGGSRTPMNENENGNGNGNVNQKEGVAVIFLVSKVQERCCRYGTDEWILILSR